jgi:oligopeptide/dipeptide ABC transporter ATP-binding protein
MAMIFISHDLGVVAGLAHQVAVMYAGRIVERAPAAALFGRPLMPYTEGLLSATPRIGQAGVAISVIEGRPPDMVQPPPGCRFHPRCAHATERCAVEVPPLEEAESGHLFACWHPLAAPAPLTDVSSSAAPQPPAAPQFEESRGW